MFVGGIVVVEGVEVGDIDVELFLLCVVFDEVLYFVEVVDLSVDVGGRED